MGKVAWYVFALILIFLLLAYYKGFSSDVTAGGGVINTIITTLQGRTKSGGITNYPV